jgi:hypothetical protein
MSRPAHKELELKTTARAAVLFMPAAMIPVLAPAAPTPEELAMIVQNRKANLNSVPLQNNTNFDVGPLSGTQNVLNIQPVITVSLSKDWSLITRTIVPIITQPRFTPDQGSTTGLGDIRFSAFRLPANAAGLFIGWVGPGGGVGAGFRGAGAGGRGVGVR